MGLFRLMTLPQVGWGLVAGGGEKNFWKKKGLNRHDKMQS